MLPALVVPVLAAALLLACAAPAKLRTPDVAARALEAAGAPGGRTARRTLVRLLGAGELAVAGAVLLVPSPVTLGVLALAYAGFAGFVVVLLRRGVALSSCGCFGRPDTPATPAHVVVVALLAVVAGTAAVTGSYAAVPALFAAGALTGATVVVLALLATAGLWAALAVVPLVRAAARPAVANAVAAA
jgi:hypothetical protein